MIFCSLVRAQLYGAHTTAIQLNISARYFDAFQMMNTELNLTGLVRTESVLNVALLLYQELLTFVSIVHIVSVLCLLA